MELISLVSVAILTGKSERTLWRWISDGTLKRSNEETANGKAMVYLEGVKPHLCIPVAPEDFELIIHADAGDPEAQNDLALLFLSHDRPEGALYWLNLAAQKNYADAMHWLARCYIDGNGVEKDENLGMMWLAKAAAHGHVIAQGQMQSIRDALPGKAEF